MVNKRIRCCNKLVTLWLVFSCNNLYVCFLAMKNSYNMVFIMPVLQDDAHLLKGNHDQSIPLKK